MMDAVLKQREEAVREDGCKEVGAERRVRSGVGKRNKAIGARGEDAAARFLYRRGYEILERNWECFAGEADIIAKDDDTVVFVEVKTRNGCDHGFPSEAVTASKRHRYEKIALAYLSECEEEDVPVRFDVVSIVVISSHKAMVRHQINAFSVTER